MVAKAEGGDRASPCAQEHHFFIPFFAITISTYPQHKEMDIPILDTAVHFLSSLGLNCCFIALPYQGFKWYLFLLLSTGMMHLAASTSVYRQWNPGSVYVDFYLWMSYVCWFRFPHVYTTRINKPMQWWWPSLLTLLHQVTRQPELCSTIGFCTDMGGMEGESHCTDIVQHGVPRETPEGIKAYLNMFFKIVNRSQQTSQFTFIHHSAPRWITPQARFQYSFFFF